MAAKYTGELTSLATEISLHERSKLEKFRFQITKRYQTLLRLENRSNSSQIENLRLMCELENVIKQVKDKHHGIPTLLSEIQNQPLDKSQSAKLRRVQTCISVFVAEWNRFERKHRKHQDACDDHTYERNQIGIERAAMWNHCLKVDNLDYLETILAYFESQKVLYPPVPHGEQLKQMWDASGFETRILAIVQDLSQLARQI